MRLGDYLVEAGLITETELRSALERQQKQNVRLGLILSTIGIVGRYQLYKALSRVWGLPFVDLVQEPPSPDLVRMFPPRFMIQAGFVPIAKTADEATIAITERPIEELRDSIRRTLGVRDLQCVVTTPWDIHHSVNRIFEHELVDEAIHSLARERPSQSAQTVLTQAQFIALILGIAGTAAGLFVYPRMTLVVINLALSIVFLSGILFKFGASIASFEALRLKEADKSETDELTDDELPVYTILVPVYRESNVIGLLMKNLAGLDYPPEKLEILVLLEQDDSETIEAAKKAKPPSNVQLITVPNRIPKTKPKACNYGLAFAQGEFLVIYDAEDRPQADQLRKAVAAFRKGPLDLVCVQAALNYFNVRENFLTRMFTLEYSYWFDYLQPGLERLDLPIPLGGTSNHFRTDFLRNLGAWDPFNVTEDADLGMRASACGFRVGTIDSTTYEEANNRYGNWLRQRSRWIKGYMQTTLVNLRSPVQLVRQIGWWKTAGFLLLVGGNPLGALAAPILWTIYVVWLLTYTHAFEPIFPTSALYLGLFNLLAGNALIIYLSMLSVFRRKHYDLIGWALLSPLYWLFQSVAAYKALYQLFTRPFFWEKTIHGLSNQAHNEAAT